MLICSGICQLQTQDSRPSCACVFMAQLSFTFFHKIFFISESFLEEEEEENTTIQVLVSKEREREASPSLLTYSVLFSSNSSKKNLLPVYCRVAGLLYTAALFALSSPLLLERVEKVHSCS